MEKAILSTIKQSLTKKWGCLKSPKNKTGEEKGTYTVKGGVSSEWEVLVPW